MRHLNTTREWVTTVYYKLSVIGKLTCGFISLYSTSLDNPSIKSSISSETDDNY